MTCWALTPVRELTTIFAAGLFLFAAASMSAQTFNVIYNFTGGTDGGNPVGGLAIDAAGNLYGSAFTGGAGYGTTYELSPSGSGWTFNTLYSFLGFPQTMALVRREFISLQMARWSVRHKLEARAAAAFPNTMDAARYTN